ncbi:MAG: hypothetical protein AAF688_02670 [Bacteroidota bacterium]
MRTKNCAICNQSFDTIYRIQYKPGKTWEFVCESCLLGVKPNNPHYRYGGTWKR